MLTSSLYIYGVTKKMDEVPCRMKVLKYFDFFILSFIWYLYCFIVKYSDGVRSLTMNFNYIKIFDSYIFGDSKIKTKKSQLKASLFKYKYHHTQKQLFGGVLLKRCS